MSFSWSLRKLFSSKKNVRHTGRPQVKDLEVFRLVPNQIVQQIDDIKVTLTAASDRGPLDHKKFTIKLSSFVKHLKQNDVLLEYVHCVYPENQQQRCYYLIVDELSRTCDELSSNLKNMEFFNIRNARVAEMMIEINQIKSCHREKRTQVYTDLELMLKKRLTHKWSKLKTSNDKQLLERFLNEIEGQMDVNRTWQKEAKRIMWISTRAKSSASDPMTKTTYERQLEQSTGNDEVPDDVRCTDDLDNSFASASVTDSPSSVVVEYGGGWYSVEEEAGSWFRT